MWGGVNEAKRQAPDTLQTGENRRGWVLLAPRPAGCQLSNAQQLGGRGVIEAEIPGHGRVRNPAFVGVQTLRQIRVLAHSPAPSFVGQRENERQGGVVERDRRG